VQHDCGGRRRRQRIVRHGGRGEERGEAAGKTENRLVGGRRCLEPRQGRGHRRNSASGRLEELGGRTCCRLPAGGAVFLHYSVAGQQPYEQLAGHSRGGWWATSGTFGGLQERRMGDSRGSQPAGAPLSMAGAVVTLDWLSAIGEASVPAAGYPRNRPPVVLNSHARQSRSSQLGVSREGAPRCRKRCCGASARELGGGACS